MNSLTIQQQALLELIKIGIGTSNGSFDFSYLSAEDWEWVMNESRIQSVVLLAFDAAKDFVTHIPKDIYIKWFGYAAKTLSNNLKVLNEQKALTNILDNNNIPYIILKGSSSAHYYPNPESRSYGDVDFLIDDIHQNKSIQILLNEGYRILPEESDWHYSLQKNNVIFELHKKACGIPEGNPGKIFDGFLRNCTQSSFKDANNISLSDPTVHGVIILLHSIHHLVGFGMGIRHLCDWACFIQKTYNNSFWSSTLLPLLKKTGTLEFAAMLTKISSLYLGTVCPLWAEKPSYELCDAVIHDIFSLGNFGRKNTEKSFGGLMMPSNSKKLTFFRKIILLFKTLWSTNRMMYPILRKLPFLFPFIMVWRVLKYCFLMLIGKRPSIFKSSKFACERNAIYSQLHLFEQGE